jgi:mRNA deadenylase 3'-5' endonuclease subunit Ccr4
MKLEYVKNALTEYDLDILFIQEAELRESNQEDLYSAQGYTTELCATAAGSKVRMMCYVKDNIFVREL